MLINFTITLLEHALTMFPNLLYFLDSWVLYKRKKGTPLFGPRCTPPSSWKLKPRRKPNNHEPDCASKMMK